MTNVIVVQDKFDGDLPFTANHWYEKWSLQGKVELIRQVDQNNPLCELLSGFSNISRLVVLGIPISAMCISLNIKVKEAFITGEGENIDKLKSAWKEKGTIFIERKSEGMWGQSVSEFALAMTLADASRISSLFC